MNITPPMKVGIVLAFIVYYLTRSYSKTAFIILAHILLHMLFTTTTTL